MKILTLLLSCLAAAQSFEVASVKAVPIDAGSYKPAGASRSMTMNASGIGYNSVTLKACILAAYQVKGYQVTGPSWIESETQVYDISAKTAAPASDEQVRLMLQALLAERFKLTLHREKKELPVYALERSMRDFLDGNAIFTQVQEQLGLKLEAQKAPFEVLVIDHAEKVPTAN
jgi:hypothetical protein